MKAAHTRERLLAPIWRRLRLLLSRGVLRRSDSAKGLQRLQVELLAGEAREVEHLENYGFTSRPLKGAETLHAAVGGVRGHLVALFAADRRHRLRDLAPGEVALYTDEGDRIVLKRGRIVEVIAGAALQVAAPVVTVTASTKISLDTPLTEISGDLTVAGEVRADQDVLAGEISLQTHVHGGVQPGGGNTGAPAA